MWWVRIGNQQSALSIQPHELMRDSPALTYNDGRRFCRPSGTPIFSTPTQGLRPGLSYAAPPELDCGVSFIAQPERCFLREAKPPSTFAAYPVDIGIVGESGLNRSHNHFSAVIFFDA